MAEIAQAPVAKRRWFRWSLRTMLLVASLSVVGVVAWLAVASRRADIIDPTVLAGMPSSGLRNGEIEILVRAAFRNADKVTVSSEVKTSEHEWRKPTIITDRDTLSELADCFTVGSDDEKLPQYPHPGMTYTRVRFDGPYKPDLTFTEDKQIFLHDGRHVAVATKFVRKLGDLLGLEVFSQ